VGITLHENQGDAKLNEKEGWFWHWESIDSVQLGEGIVIDPKVVKEAIINKSDVADQSNLYVVTTSQKELTSYAGFAWEKSGQVSSVGDWEALLEKQARMIQSPLSVTVHQ